MMTGEALGSDSISTRDRRRVLLAALAMSRVVSANDRGCHLEIRPDRPYSDPEKRPPRKAAGGSANSVEGPCRTAGSYLELIKRVVRRRRAGLTLHDSGTYVEFPRRTGRPDCLANRTRWGGDLI